MTDQASLRSLHTPETRVMLLTAGGEGNDAEIRDLVACPEFRWSELLAMCEWERAFPVAWARLKPLVGDRMPAHYYEAFARLSRVCAFQQETLRLHFERLVRALNERGIDLIPLKGAALATGVYAHWHERPMGDLDLLMSLDRARNAWEVALRVGWTWEEDKHPSARYAGHHHLPPLFDAERTGAKLELHTTLSVAGHPFAMTFEELAERSERQRYPFGEVLLMPAEELFVHVAVHFAWAHLATLGLWRLARDVDQLARRGLSWERVAEIADRYHANSSVYWSLRLTGALCGVDPSPPGFLDRVKPRRQWMETLVAKHMALHAVGRAYACPSVKWRRAMWSLALDPRSSALRGVRPWESEEAEVASHARHDTPVVSRIRVQVSSGDRWRSYFRHLRQHA